MLTSGFRREALGLVEAGAKASQRVAHPQPCKLTLKPATSPNGRVPLTWDIEETRLDLEGRSSFPFIDILPDYSSQKKVFKHSIMLLNF